MNTGLCSMLSMAFCLLDVGDADSIPDQGSRPAIFEASLDSSEFIPLGSEMPLNIHVALSPGGALFVGRWGSKRAFLWRSRSVGRAVHKLHTITSSSSSAPSIQCTVPSSSARPQRRQPPEPNPNSERAEPKTDINSRFFTRHLRASEGAAQCHPPNRPAVLLDRMTPSVRKSLSYVPPAGGLIIKSIKPFLPPR